MAIDKTLVEHVANLSRLRLSKDECELYTKELSSILSYFSCLNELDTEGVAPTSQVNGLKSVTGEDEVSDAFCSRESLLESAPLPVREHQIQIYRVIE